MFGPKAFLGLMAQGIVLSDPPDEQQLLSPPDWQGTQAHHAQVQQHEEEAAQPVLDAPCVHPSIPEDQPQGDSCHQGGYEVDKNEEGVAVQLAHEAGGQHSELEEIGGVGPGGAEGPGILAQILHCCIILGCYVRPAVMTRQYQGCCCRRQKRKNASVVKSADESLVRHFLFCTFQLLGLYYI